MAQPTTTSKDGLCNSPNCASCKAKRATAKELGGSALITSYGGRQIVR